MNAIDLYINDMLVDLDGVDVIASTIAANKFQDIATRSGNLSNEFKLPMTANNLNIIENVNQITSGSRFDKTLARATIYENGALVLYGFAQIAKTDNRITMRIFSGNSEWIGLLGDSELQDLDLSEYNHTFNAANVNANRNNTEGYVYPNCFYGVFSNNTIPWRFMDFFPAVYYKTIITKIFSSLGYSISGSILEDELFLKSVVPTSGRIVTRASELNPLTIATGTLDTAGVSFTGPAGLLTGVYPGITSTSDLSGVILANVFTGTLSDAARTYIVHPGNYIFAIDLTFTNSTTGSFGVRLVDKDTGSILVSLDITMDAGVNNRAYVFPNLNLAKDTEVVVEYFVDKTSPLGQVDTISGTLSFGTEQDYSFYNNCFPGQTMEVYQALPIGTKQKDFLLHVFNQFSILITVDAIDKVIYINKFDDVYTNIPNAVDLSEFVDHTEYPLTEFEFENYAINNHYRYAEDDKDERWAAGYGDGVVVSDKKTLQKDKDVFQSKFSGIFLSVINAFPYPEIAVINTRNPQQNLGPKCAYVEIQTDQNITINGQPPLTTNANLFFDKFKFDTYLLDTYHKLEANAITLQKVYTLNIRLNQSHIQQLTTGTTGLSFTKPVYLNTIIKGNHVEGYFFINQVIQYKHGKKESTQVELVSIL